MKMKMISLVGFLLFISLFSVQCDSTFKPKDLFQNFYYVQKLYPGKDFIASMKAINQMKLAYFTLNKKMLFYSPSLEKKNKVEDSIPLAKIVDKKFDNPVIGKCCYNIIYHNFAKSINRKKAAKSKFKANGILNILESNYCIEIQIPEQARWRICSNKQSNISKLHRQIAFNIMLLSNKKKTPALAATFLKNFKVSEYESNVDFTWDNQLKWKNRCQSRFIQSPVNIKKPHIVENLQKDFSITYNFYDVYPIVARRFNEAIIKFSHHPGIVLITLNNNNILFKPKFISFRFPGEHSFTGKRFNGEMLIHLKELNPDKKRHTVNSLIITVPFENNRQYKNQSVLESLNMDFWKYSLSRKSEHKPKNFLTNQRTVFSLPEIFNQITVSRSRFFFYLGSETVPPCSEFVYHLVVEKPLKISNCQLKLLRENSLLVNGFKQIHSRLTQHINNRNIYTIDKLIMNTNVESVIPKEFFDLAEELYGEPLLEDTLSTVDRLQALNALRKGLKKGKISKYDKKGRKIVRKGVPIKDSLYGDYDGWDEENTDPEYQKKFGKKGKYAKYGKYAGLFGRVYGSGRGHGHIHPSGTGADGSGSDLDGDLNC